MKKYSWLLIPLIGLGFTVQSAHADYSSQRVSKHGHDRSYHDSGRDRDRRAHDNRREHGKRFAHGRDHHQGRDHFRHDRRDYYGAHDKPGHFTRHGHHKKYRHWDRHYDRHFWRNAQRRHLARHKYRDFRYFQGLRGYGYNPPVIRHGPHCRHLH